MVQFLDRQPSTAERFGKAFANFGQAAGQKIPEMLQGQQQQRQQEQLQQQQKQATANLSNEDVANLPPELQKAWFSNQMKLQGQQQQQQFKQQLEQQEGQKKKAEEQQKLTKLINRAEEIKPSTGFSWYPLAWNRKRVEERAEIDAIGSEMADYAYVSLLGNKGALSKDKINELMKKYMISSEDSERVYQGKLNALKLLMENSEQGLSADQAFAMSEKTLSEETMINDEEAAAIFKEAGNNPEKARKIAKERGYSF